MSKNTHGADADSSQYRQILNESARLLQANRPGEAVKKLLPLYRERSDDIDVAINLGGAYIMQQQWTKAVQVLEPATRAHPENAMAWTNLAAAYLGRLEIAGPRQQEQAIYAYEQAVQADPQTPNVHYHLGLIHKERGDLNRASAHFQRALETDPTDKDARYWLDRLAQMLVEPQSQRQQKNQDDPDKNWGDKAESTSSDAGGGGKSQDDPGENGGDPENS